MRRSRRRRFGRGWSARDGARAFPGALQRRLVVAFWDEEERGLRGSLAYALRAKARSENIDAVYVFDMIGVKSDAPGSQQFPTGVESVFPEVWAAQKSHQDRADFIALIYDRAQSEAETLDISTAALSNGLRTLRFGVPETPSSASFLYDLYRSDHTAFWLTGYPGILITDTAGYRYPAYHCRSGPDVVENLDHDFSVQVIRAVTVSAAQALRVRR